MIYDALEAMALTALPDQVLALFKCAAVLEGAAGCDSKLKEFGLDEYAEELLAKSKTKLKELHDMEKMTAIISLDDASEAHAPYHPRTLPHPVCPPQAMRILNEIHKSKDGVKCLERLEAFALHLLGLATVAEVKVKAIASILEAAMEGQMSTVTDPPCHPSPTPPLRTPSPRSPGRAG